MIHVSLENFEYEYSVVPDHAIIFLFTRITRLSNDIFLKVNVTKNLYISLRTDRTLKRIDYGFACSSFTCPARKHLVIKFPTVHFDLSALKSNFIILDCTYALMDLNLFVKYFNNLLKRFDQKIESFKAEIVKKLKLSDMTSEDMKLSTYNSSEFIIPELILQHPGYDLDDQQQRLTSNGSAAYITYTNFDSTNNYITYNGSTTT
jgi:hypothetical protein